MNHDDMLLVVRKHCNEWHRRLTIGEGLTYNREFEEMQVVVDFWTGIANDVGLSPHIVRRLELLSVGRDNYFEDFASGLLREVVK